MDTTIMVAGNDPLCSGSTYQSGSYGKVFLLFC